MLRTDDQITRQVSCNFGEIFLVLNSQSWRSNVIIKPATRLGFNSLYVHCSVEEERDIAFLIASRPNNHVAPEATLAVGEMRHFLNEHFLHAHAIWNASLFASTPLIVPVICAASGSLCQRPESFRGLGKTALPHDTTMTRRLSDHELQSCKDFVLAILSTHPLCMQRRLLRTSLNCTREKWHRCSSN